MSRRSGTRWRWLVLPALLAACGGGAAGSGPAATAASGVQVSGSGPGAVEVELNQPPVLSSMWLVRQELRTEGEGGGVDVEVAARAADPDGDDLEYAWSAPTCPGAVLTPAPSGGADRILVHLPDSSAGCAVELVVLDFWKGHAPPAGSGLSPARGGAATGTIHVAPTTAPAIVGR
ncbi:hypothetical protein [Anaeromyxobacter paludicola]|uniref:hypothetical protein n=1 Tax=Anaeromyxobacter paludicola TaxID=2918171 RepID=UPI0020C0648E|nr:hypothetical protein [Anaeromyxobacter paludicola]